MKGAFDDLDNLQYALRGSLGAYAVKFTTVRPRENIYEAEIKLQGEDKPSMITPFSCGMAWLEPSAILLLDAIVNDYLNVEDEGGAVEYLASIGIDEEKIPQMSKALDKQAKDMRASLDWLFLDHVRAIVCNAGIDFGVIAPFLIVESRLDGKEIRIEGRMR